MKKETERKVFESKPDSEPDKVRRYEFDDVTITVGTHYDQAAKDTFRDILKRNIMREVDKVTSPDRVC